MKLKNKLIISFLMIMAIPLFLFCVFSVVLVRYQFVIIQNSYGVSAELTDFFPNNNKLFSVMALFAGTNFCSFVNRGATSK